MIDRNEKERVYEQLDSPGWTFVLRAVLKLMRTWARDLLENPNLDESKRKGFVYAMNALKAGITGFYAQVDRTLPTWLDQEFNFYRDDE